MTYSLNYTMSTGVARSACVSAPDTLKRHGELRRAGASGIIVRHDQQIISMGELDALIAASKWRRPPRVQ